MAAAGGGQLTRESSCAGHGKLASRACSVAGVRIHEGTSIKPPCSHTYGEGEEGEEGEWEEREGEEGEEGGGRGVNNKATMYDTITEIS